MIRHAKATGPGSRARTREIGYSEAMADMAVVLDGLAQTFRALELYAAEGANWKAADLMSAAADLTGKYVKYAWAIWDLHGDGRPPLDPKSMIALDWRHGPAPRELPGEAQAGRDA